MQQEDVVRVELIINGKPVAATTDPATTLQACLHHEMGFKEVRYGCGEGVCGACTVLIDGEPRASCLLLAAQAEGKSIITSSGLTDNIASARQLYEQFIARQAFQCGYCACGMMISGAHHVETSSNADSADLARELSGNLCRCTGYLQIIESISATVGNLPAPAQQFPRIDIQEKLTGAAGYPTDRQQKHPLIGRILWSEWPSARITAIDTTAAKSVPGVEAVLTAADIPGLNNTGAAVFASDQPLLAEKAVNTMADAIALVAAHSVAAADEALEKIKVSYDPSAPVTDVFASVKEGARKLSRKGNVVAQFIEVHGDVDTAFQRADVIVEADYATTSNDHGGIELEGGTGWMEGDTVVLTIPHQTPDTGQRSVARMLGISADRVQILSARIGGSFGKYAVATIEGYLALLVYHTRKPVRLQLSREEMLQRRTKRHPSYGKYRLALTKEGKFLGLEAEALTDAGPYVWLTPAVTAVIPAEAAGAYEIENVRARARGVLTNNLITAPMRGYGSQQISYGIEAIVERAAHELNMDPAELRKKNLKTHRTDGNGKPIAEAQLALAQTIDCVIQRLGPRPKVAPDRLFGRGIATVHAKYGYPYGIGDRFAIRIKVDSQGRFSVESDIGDSGTAVPNEMVRLLARSLGLSTLPSYSQNRSAMDDPTGNSFSRNRSLVWWQRRAYRFIEWLQTFSARQMLRLTANMKLETMMRVTKLISTPVNFITGSINSLKSWLFPFSRDSFQPRFGSSRAVSLCASAVLNGLGNLKKEATDVAGKLLQVSPSKLLVDSRGVNGKNQTLSWAQLAEASGGSLSVMGEAHNPDGQFFDPQTGNQRGAIDYMDATHGCDLEINPATGEVRILNYIACHDVGYAFNREAVRGQILGGTMMGVGQALLEQVRSVDGKVINVGLHDYLVPTALEMPAKLEVEILESGSGIGPNGSKGVGESAAVAAPIAISNALYDALGVQPRQTPTTPEDIVEIISHKQ
jgi:nicotinate dehydrogenase large molybdopterin subunit